MEPNNMQPGTEPVQTPNPGQDDVRIIGEMPRRPAKRGLYTLIAVLVMLTVAAIFVRDQVFKIRDVEIRSVQNISQEEVMRLSGITANTSYFGLNEEKIRAGIENNRYLRFESMEKVWPNGVILNIQERQPCINVLNAGIQYVVASDGMVLEAYASLRLDNGCIKTTGLNIRDIRVGSQVICYNSEQLDAMLNIVAELDAQGCMNEIAEMNLSMLDSIYLVTTDSYVANIGDAQQLRPKIGTVRAVVTELRNRGLKGGMIEATVPGEASYRPVSN